ncbi:ribosomal protein S18 acetylase RimI-like enzyme [Tamaricihabitans halophyticus]|uniref:Ribosomal protein S18 acetylase RimI-like enzyme n=1 Tax=Tamaricihabitans halophyticus TaxID=1262583 RepID=A0A4R2R0Z8_9PSEU|nr:GNAT family N-acetyltransferase [Tamaricihabitans halophyticus]TCP55148.1 ribosomal protein S18 acetylase RimI-like enzyme [Tamaricihabitans halophyticus]
MGSSDNARITRLTAEELRARLPEALRIYVRAMRYPAGTAEQRAPMWLSHMLRVGWRCVVATDTENTLVGIAYGYYGARGQWWHEQVRNGLSKLHGTETADTWLRDYFELTELHVQPENQGKGTGEDLLRLLLADLPVSQVLLSTPEGTSKAWGLYRKTGFTDVLRDYRFAGDPRPFAVLGRALPMPARDQSR